MNVVYELVFAKFLYYIGVNVYVFFIRGDWSVVAILDYIDHLKILGSVLNFNKNSRILKLRYRFVFITEC